MSVRALSTCSRSLSTSPLNLIITCFHPPSTLIFQAKLAKLRRELLEPSGTGSGGGGRGDGFDVTKVGDARVGLVGFPSVGKSTLLTKLTGTFSEVAAYEFTTLTCVPGVIRYRGAKIQLLDLPGIIEGAKDGKGRGRQVIATARTCNLIIIVLDVLKPLTHKRLIEHELEGFGIRLNKRPPAITYRKKERGGIAFTASPDCTRLDLDAVKAVLSEYRVHNADVHVRGDCDVDDLVDVIEGNRTYVPAVYAVNKVRKRKQRGEGNGERNRRARARAHLNPLSSLSSSRMPHAPTFILSPSPDRPDHAGGAEHHGPPAALRPRVRVPGVEPGRPGAGGVGTAGLDPHLHQAQGQAARLE